MNFQKVTFSGRVYTMSYSLMKYNWYYFKYQELYNQDRYVSLDFNIAKYKSIETSPYINICNLHLLIKSVTVFTKVNKKQSTVLKAESFETFQPFIAVTFYAFIIYICQNLHLHWLLDLYWVSTVSQIYQNMLLMETVSIK